MHQYFCNQYRLRTLARWLCCLSLIVTLSGCNYFMLLGYLIGGPPSIEPDFDKMTKKSFTDYQITVAVVCYAPTELKYDFANVDDEIAKYVSYRFKEHKIEVIHPDHVRAWLDRNPDWEKPEEIGEAFETDYVVYIDVNKYSLYEENSANLYRGRSEALVSVFEMGTNGEGDKIYSKEIVSVFPIHTPRAASSVSYQTFKRQYLSRLSEEIGRLFYEHFNGDNIPDGA